jgi:hypothetical protein
MTTFIFPKGEKKALKQFLEVIEEFHEEFDIVVTNDNATGTISAPNKKKNYYTTLPFALSHDLFSKPGHNEFFSNDYHKFAIYVFKQGIVEPKEEISKNDQKNSRISDKGRPLGKVENTKL